MKRRPPIVRMGDLITLGHPGGCWEWQGRMSRNGYGRFFFSGREQAAHRVVYQILVGPLESGLQLDHLCRNRVCVRPSHMEPVTAQTNTHRAYRGSLGRDAQGRYRRRTEDEAA